MVVRPSGVGLPWERVKHPCVWRTGLGRSNRRAEVHPKPEPVVPLLNTEPARPWRQEILMVSTVKRPRLHKLFCDWF